MLKFFSIRGDYMNNKGVKNSDFDKLNLKSDFSDSPIVFNRGQLASNQKIETEERSIGEIILTYLISILVFITLNIVLYNYPVTQIITKNELLNLLINLIVSFILSFISSKFIIFTMKKVKSKRR